jgi:hypothetical protein
MLVVLAEKVAILAAVPINMVIVTATQSIETLALQYNERKPVQLDCLWTRISS